MYRLKARLSVICLLLILLSSSLFASDFRLWDPKDGLPVRQGHDIEWFRSMNTDSNGNICVVWSDTRLGDRDVWAQLITSDGTSLWGDKGKLIVSEYSRQEEPHVFPDGNGNWIITWIDFRYDFEYNNVGDVYMQKVDSNGDRMWSPASGVKICDAARGQLWQQSFTDNNGGAVIIWIDNREDQTDIYAQHVDQSGNVLWEESGKKVAGGPGSQGSYPAKGYSACTDDEGGIIFSWRDNRDVYNLDLYINRVSVDGELVWADSSGLPLCLNPERQSNVRLAKDGNGGVFVVWEDDRNYDLHDQKVDIYSQHVASDGTINWAENGVPICNYSATQQRPRIVNTGVNEAVVLWEDKRVDFETEDLYSQKISNNNGSLQLHWGPTGQELSGNLVCDAAWEQTQARLASDMNGGVYISWADERWHAKPNSVLYGQHLDSNGNRDWGDPNGIIICDRVLQYTYPFVSNFNDNRAGFVWLDFGFGSPAIYYQIIDINGNEQLQENGEEIIYGIGNYVYSPNVIPSNGDNKIIIWEEGHFGRLGRYPYMQRVNGRTGEILDEINGFSLTPGFPYGESDTTRVEIRYRSLTSISDNNGGAIVAWVDNRLSEDPHIYVQKVDAEGNILWGDRGAAVAYSESDTYEQRNPFIVAVDDGGVVVIYNQLDDQYCWNIWAQRLNSNGVGQWSSEAGSGFQINTDERVDYTIFAIDTFNDGSILLVYKRYCEPSGLYAQRILLTGENAWENPVAICTADSLHDNAKMTKIGNNDFFIAWEDSRLENSIFDIYGQIISSDGTVSLEENGHPFIVEDHRQIAIDLASTDDYFWMAWQDSRDNLDDNIYHQKYDIYIQKYDLNGIPQLTPSSGILIGSDLKQQSDPHILPDGDDGIYVAWVESGDNPLNDIRYTHLKYDGTPVSVDYPQEGLPLTIAFHNQEKPVLIPDGENGFFSVWQDYRSSGMEIISNIYMQRVNDWIVSVNNTPDIQPEGWSLDNAYPNPFNPSTRISYNVGTTSEVKLTVYDILGREVIKLVDSRLETGNHFVNWNGNNTTGQMVSSGTYFYRLEADDVMITKKMVLIK